MPATNSVGSPYASFSFIANDGWTNSAPGVITVSIVGHPYTFTQPAAPVGPTNALLNGMAVPNGFATRASFSGARLRPSGRHPARRRVQRSGRRACEHATGRACARQDFLFSAGRQQCSRHDLRLTPFAHDGQPIGRVGAERLWEDECPGQPERRFSHLSGFYTTYALLTSGTVCAWGWNQTNLPVGLSDVVAISGTLALKRDGSVQDWGYGKPPVPDGLNNIIAICGESLHRLALRSDGTVLAWGYNNYGQTNVPVGLKDVVAIASANYHSLALKADGSVISWGYSNNGETNVPAGLSNVVAIACGSSRSLAATWVPWWRGQ